MTDQSPIARFPVGTRLLPGKSGATATAHQVVFLRQELSMILNTYGRAVAAGEWRDYAITHGMDCAVFSIFRRSSERPFYRITKTPALTNKQGQWTVLAMDGRVLKRGHDLRMLLRIFDQRLLSSVD